MFKTRIYAGLVIIVVLGVLTMFHIYRNLGNVAGYLATLDNISVPFSIAALEMEKNTGEYADGVLRYVADPEPTLRAEAAEDVDDFNERHAVYMRLSTNARERAMGRKVKAGHAELLAAGNALMNQRDELDKVFHHTTTLLEQIDVLLDGPMLELAPRTQPARSEVVLALQDIEAETAEVGYWLSLFRSRPTPLARQRLLEKIREQHDAVARYRALHLTTPERKFGATLRTLHQQVESNLVVLASGEADINRRAQELNELAESVDEIFDKQVQTMLLEDLSAPQQKADVAIAHVQQSLLYIIPGYILAALVIGALLIVAIIRPLRRLAAGTKAIGAGDLTHRIAVHSKDEFGQLASQFNLMAEHLQESTVSRYLLEASERQLQKTVAELRHQIIDRQQAEREREKLQVKLQRSETLAAMGRLVAGVAHEVRNPLFGISSTLDAMTASADAGRSDPRYRVVLRREVDRLNKLMAELLEYGRTLPAEHVIEPLGKSLAKALRTCQPAAKAAGVTLQGRITADAMVAMSRDRLL
ncbi:MAG: HAMP domain-containing protein, partial [Luteimonas sp.]|nr:HAMP domain-containing protein [Luteimonas sp.]